jgi:AcrR family transcriptional regulator
MMAIAKRAGLSHPMLHYYFRSKENLFRMIFSEKISTLYQAFEKIDSQRLPFFDMIRSIVEKQFDFVAQNPKLPRFVLNEVISSKERIDMLMDVIGSKLAGIFGYVETALNEEIAKGTVRPIAVRDLMMNIVSMNISTFLYISVMENSLSGFDEKMKEMYLSERRESNVQFIIKALQP